MRCIVEFCDGVLIFPKPRAPTSELEKIRASLPYKPLGSSEGRSERKLKRIHIDLHHFLLALKFTIP